MGSVSLVRKIWLLIANILIPIACLIFATGFFPYKPFLPGLATFEDQNAREEMGLLAGSEEQEKDGSIMAERMFDKVIFMVVDALRSDFVYGNSSGFDFTQSLIRDGAALPYTAHAAPPTVTMPRVKGLTTGSVPSFVDLILNFAEGDSTSSLASQDSWLAQIRSHHHKRSGDGEEGRIRFYGDDTWLKLFPDLFSVHDGTSSFFVSDFTEVDNNVTRHLPSALESKDWDAMIMHYLGLDHIGHKTGPEGPNMPAKQKEMDSVFRQMFEAIETNDHLEDTLLVIAGDHGMNSAGNHGGSAPGETSTALLFASHKFRSTSHLRTKYLAPATPKEGTEFDFHRKVEQSDLVPTLCAFLGIPIPRNNLGVVIPEVLDLWQQNKAKNSVENHVVQILYRNALQVLEIVKATFGEGMFVNIVGTKMKTPPCSRRLRGGERLQCLWGRAQRMLLGASLDGRHDVEDQVGALRDFLNESQEMLSTTASTYDVIRLGSGIAIAFIATMFAFFSLPSGDTFSAPVAFFTTMTLLYGVMMFASSYVEEEQHFWYWMTSAWIIVLSARKIKTCTSTKGHAVVLVLATTLLGCHRIAIRWNQTGQKHAGAPDISRSFFPAYPWVLWILVLGTYVRFSSRLARRTLEGIVPAPAAALLSVVTIFQALLFKIKFAQADSPELIGRLGLLLEGWHLLSGSEDEITLVTQARIVFSLLAVLLVTVCVGTYYRTRRGAQSAAALSRQPSSAHRLHDLLTVLLITQSRINNVPLFLIWSLQLEIIRYFLMSRPTSSASSSPSSSVGSITSTATITTTSLLLSQTSYYLLGGSNAISSIDLGNAYNGISGYNIGAVGILLFISNWAGPIWWSGAGALLLRCKAHDPTKPEIVRFVEDLLSRTETFPQETSKPPPRSENNADETTTKPTQSWIEAERAHLSIQAQPESSLSTTSQNQAQAQNQTRSQAKSDATIISFNPSQPNTKPSWTIHYSLQTLFVTASLTGVMAACTALRTHLFIWTVFSPKFLYAVAWSVGWHLGVGALVGGLYAVG